MKTHHHGYIGVGYASLILFVGGHIVYGLIFLVSVLLLSLNSIIKSLIGLTKKKGIKALGSWDSLIEFLAFNAVVLILLYSRDDYYNSGLIIAAFLGGIVIDFDHVLYHVRYMFSRRDKNLKKFYGSIGRLKIKEAFQWLAECEDKRLFDKLLFHKFYFLFLCTLIFLIVCIFFTEIMISLSSFFYFLPFFGTAFLLHMIFDIAGDFIKVGHFNNWLKTNPLIFRRKQPMSINSIYRQSKYYLGFVVIGFLAISFICSYQPDYPGFLNDLTYGFPYWLIHLPLIIISIIIILGILLCLASIFKYINETSIKINIVKSSGEAES